jgi:tetratricopeptide (TPR) repeat protein
MVHQLPFVPLRASLPERISPMLYRLDFPRRPLSFIQSDSIRRSLALVLLAAALVSLPQASRAQTTYSTFDTLDVRHDLSKPALLRFKAAQSHTVSCMYAGRTEEQRSAALLMLDIATELKQDSLLAAAHATLSYSCRESLPGQGLDLLYKALKYAERRGVPDQIGWVQKEIGVLFKQIGQYREAITWLERGEANITAIGEVNRTACHMSESYSGLGMLDSALFYAQRSNVITTPEYDPYGYSRSQLILGKAYAAKGEAAMAELFFKKAIVVCDSFDVARVMPAALVGLGYVRLAAQDANGAIGLGRRALDVAERTSNLPSSLEATDLLEKAYHAAGKPDSAYLSLKEHSVLQDSLVNVEALSKVENMRFGQQLKEKEEAVAKAEAAAARSRNIQFGIIALIVITLGIFLLIFSRTAVVGAKAIKNLSLIALLLFFEFINLLIHPFLDRITNHSPILMLLCMAAIAGLLIPLHHRMEKLITNMLVSKNNRVRLEAARRTIEELEARPSDTNAS